MRIGAMLAAAGALLLGFAAPATATPVTDCPLRDAPFSIGSPLIDVLLSPAAKAAVEREWGTSFDGASRMLSGTQAPTFTAILSVQLAGTFLKQSPDAIARADAALRRIPVTAADRVARCQRYDNDTPRLALPPGQLRVLVFEKVNGFKDVPGFDAAHRLFFALARENGWKIVATDRGGAINSATLRRFDVVVWNNISGDVLTTAQRRAFREYIERGGAFIGVHGSAGDPVYWWDWYVDGLIGARFSGHPLAKPFQEARVVVGGDGAIAEGLPREWAMTDEWYSFSTNPRQAGADVLAVLDERSYDPAAAFGVDLRMGDHPIAWTRCVGRGRMFYSAIGHRPESYDRPEYQRMLANAVRWAADRRACIGP